MERVRPVGESRQSLPVMRRIAVTCAVVFAVVAITMLVADGRDAEVNDCAVPQCEH